MGKTFRREDRLRVRKGLGQRVVDEWGALGLRVSRAGDKVEIALGRRELKRRKRA